MPLQSKLLIDDGRRDHAGKLARITQARRVSWSKSQVLQTASLGEPPGHSLPAHMNLGISAYLSWSLICPIAIAELTLGAWGIGVLLKGADVYVALIKAGD